MRREELAYRDESGTRRLTVLDCPARPWHRWSRWLITVGYRYVSETEMSRHAIRRYAERLRSWSVEGQRIELRKTVKSRDRYRVS